MYPRSAASVALALGLIACTGAGFSATQRPMRPERIAFLARVDAFWQVFVADSDGGNARQLTSSAVEKSRVTWYPDGEALLVNTQEGDVRRVDVETGAESLVALPVHGMLDAAISPDGRRVAFSVTQSDSRDANELWVCDLDGGNLRELTNRAGLQHSPAWDPRSQKIYYLSDLGPRGRHDIWRIDASGSGDEQLTFGELRHLDVAVSARGEIAYSGNQSGNYDVWLKTPEKPAQRLTDDPALDAHPSFSPDGQRIVFESARGGSLNLWLIAREGGPATQLTRLDAPGARMPAWGPGSP